MGRPMRTDGTTVSRRLVERCRLLVYRAGFQVSRETFKRRFVQALHTHGIDTVLDIGANRGQFGGLLRQSGFTGRIVSVEPLAAAVEALTTAAGNDPRWTVERAAVSDHAGGLTVHVSANSVSSSVLPMAERHASAAPQSRYVGSEDVPATTVDDLVARHGVDPASTLLKIDVQGYEAQVLDGGAATLPRLAGLRTEMSLVPLYDGQALLPDILARLSGCGLELWFVDEGFLEPGTGRLLQVDGTFFRQDSG